MRQACGFFVLAAGLAAPSAGCGGAEEPRPDARDDARDAVDDGGGGETPADVPEAGPEDAGEAPPEAADAEVPAEAGAEDGAAEAPETTEADAEPDATPDVPPDTGPGTCGPFPGGECPWPEICDVHGCLPGAGGTCVGRPRDCVGYPEDPVCGCDGETYVNDCERLVSGVALDHEGACGSGTMCGGIAGFRCPDGEVCDVRNCWPDAGGTCVPRPADCPDDCAPVCGCDDVSYANDCKRLLAGAAYDAEGACEPASACPPECRTLPGGGTGWVDPCSDCTICEASCESCTASCDDVGSRSEGWYAHCSGSTAEPGCGIVGMSTLIEWIRCSET
jgi:hypothetical protein